MRPCNGPPPGFLSLPLLVPLGLGVSFSLLQDYDKIPEAASLYKEKVYLEHSLEV